MRPGGRAARWALLPGMAACVVALLSTHATADDGPPYPRLANLYLHGAVDPAHYESLSRWDLVVLDTVWSDAQMAQLRAYNPDIRLFAYVCAYAMGAQAPAADPWRRLNFIYAQSNDLWWRNSDGSIASDWPGAQMVNVTDIGPIGPIGNWRTFLKRRVEDLVGPRRMLDGVFYDNFWRGISWEQGDLIRVDSDCSPLRNPGGCNGVADAPAYLDALWGEAMRDIASDTRNRFDRMEPGRDRPLAILSNGASDYYQYLNGTLYEGFPRVRGVVELGNPHGYDWAQQMLGPNGYLVAPFRPAPYPGSILNADWPGGTPDAPARSPEFERHKRFTFVSALLGDGYYSLDEGTYGHGARWWEPEYDHAGRGKGYLGYPTGPAYRVGAPTGAELVANGSWTIFPVGWDIQYHRSSGTYDRDVLESHSRPGSARITVTSLQPRGYIKMTQIVPVTAGDYYTLSLWAKSDRPQSVTAHLYADGCHNRRCLEEQTFRLDNEWRCFEVSFLSTGSANAGLDIFVSQPGSVWIDDVSLRRGDSTLYRRDFDQGIVLLNYTNRPQVVNLGAEYTRLSIPGSTVWDGAAVDLEVVPPYDGRILLRAGPKRGPQPMPSKASGERFRVEPNPCRQGTAMRFSMPQDNGPAQLSIYDVAGRRVRTLVDGTREPGSGGVLVWNGEDESGIHVSPGVYFVRLQASGQSETRKITLMR